VTFIKNSINGFYEGQVDTAGKKFGIGRLVEVKGGLYEGFFKIDLYDGYVRYIFPNGDLYLGNFYKGDLSGKGTMVTKGSFVQTGAFY